MTYKVLTAYSGTSLGRAIEERLISDRIVSRGEILSLPSGLIAAEQACIHKIPLLVVDSTRLEGRTGVQVAKDLERAAEHPYHVIITIGTNTPLIELEHPERVTLVEKLPDLARNLTGVARRHLPVEAHGR